MTSNQGYKNVDYTLVYTTANEILATSTVIETFPYKTSELIKERSDVRLCTYSKAFDKFGIAMETFGSESAVIQEYCGMHIIFYNQDEPAYRIRFSIMHEFGHYVLKHKMNLSKDDPLYAKQELEANCFAAQILMPEQILRAASNRGKILGIDFIKKSFDVSDDAADKRRKTLANTSYEWRSRAEKEYDDIITLRFDRFINDIAPRKSDLYDFEDEYSRQRERDMYMDKRSRWN